MPAKKRTKSGPINDYTPPALRNAIDYARKHAEEPIAAVARKWEVSRITLTRRLVGTQRARNLVHQTEQLVENEEEIAIKEWYDEMDDAGIPVNHDMLRQLAQ